MEPTPAKPIENCWARGHFSEGIMANGFRRLCWLEWAILGFGLPGAIAGASKLLTLVVPAAQHGTLGQRYLLSLVGPVAAEWVFALAAWFSLRRRNESLRDLGAWKLGNWAGWGFALLFAGLAIASNLRFLPRMGIPISDAFAPYGFHLVASVATGITDGFCEEILFRGLLMTDFARAGYGKLAQVVLPGVSFGFSHLGYSVHGFVAAVGIMAPTAILGMMWGAAYLLGRRALVPCFVAHFLNDATALSWVGFFMFKGSLG
jgi:Type II CAAX prenyl endopeptidase Rce1-like